MVNCYTCNALLDGNWAFNHSGYSTGSYLGVNAYFAYSSPNWVYCFCSNYYNNGKFGQYIKSCYSVCINKIIDDSSAPLRQQTQNLINENAALKTQIQSLKNTTTTLRSQIKTLTESKATLRSQNQLLKNEVGSQKQQIQSLRTNIKDKQSNISLLSKQFTIFNSNQYFKQIRVELLKIDSYYSQLSDKLPEINSVFLILKKQYQAVIMKEIKTIINAFLGKVYQKLDRIKKAFASNIQKINELKHSTISSMGQKINIENLEIKVFQAPKIQDCSKIFDIQIQKKESQIKVLEGFLNPLNNANQLQV